MQLAAAYYSIIPSIVEREQETWEEASSCCKRLTESVWIWQSLFHCSRSCNVSCLSWWKKGGRERVGARRVAREGEKGRRGQNVYFAYVLWKHAGIHTHLLVCIFLRIQSLSAWSMAGGGGGWAPVARRRWSNSLCNILQAWAIEKWAPLALPCIQPIFAKNSVANHPWPNEGRIYMHACITVCLGVRMHVKAAIQRRESGATWISCTFSSIFWSCTISAKTILLHCQPHTEISTYNITSKHMWKFQKSATNIMCNLKSKEKIWKFVHAKMLQGSSREMI